jgi:hypothetical protein
MQPATPRSPVPEGFSSTQSLSPSMIYDLPVVTQSEPAFVSWTTASPQEIAKKSKAEGTSDTKRPKKKTRTRERSASETVSLQPGTRLLDRYEIIRKLGQGGMSLVYEATDEVRNEAVALKVLLPSLAAKPKLQQRFLQEGRLASNFSHPNIARVYDLHQVDQLVMLSMELLHGSTLRHDMERRKSQRQTYRPAEVAKIVEQIGQALSVVHATKQKVPPTH